MEIKIASKIVKPVLWFSQFVEERYFVVVCKGYGDDWEEYTGLDWKEDKNLELCWYEDYRVWINFC